MKKIVLYVVGIVIVGAIAMPLVVKNQMNKQIEDQKQILKQDGIELTITKEEGYFSSIREFELKILNGKKLRDFMLTEFAKKNPNYKGLAELMQKQSNKDIRPALDGTTFKGNIKNSNLYLTPTQIEISLTKFSDEIMSSISSDKKVDKLFNSILDEKLFTFFVTLDSNQKVSQIVMQDIDKDIEDNGDTVNVKLKNHKLNIDIKESLKGIYTLGEQSVSGNDFFLNTKGIEYKFDYLTQFDNSGTIHVDSFEIKEKKEVLKVGNIDISNNIETQDNALDANVKYSVKDIYLKSNDKLELDNYLLDFTLTGLDKDASIKGGNAYNQLAFNPTQDSVKNFTDALQTVLNRGFKANIKTSLDGLSFQNMVFDNADFTLNLNVEKNSYTIDSNDVIKAFLVDGKLTIDEKSIENILKVDKSFEKFAKLGKKEGSNVVFNYEFKDGNLLVNGNKI